MNINKFCNKMLHRSHATQVTGRYYSIFSTHIPTTINCAYSLNKDDELFYRWFEKQVIPIELNNNSYFVKKIRQRLYASINDPPNEYYYVGTAELELYLEEKSFTIQQVHQIKTLFTERLAISNKMGKGKLLEHYQQQKIPDYLLISKE